MKLSKEDIRFLEGLIGIDSVGGTPAEGAPYGEGPRAALDYFLKEAAKAGFATGVLDDRVGWAEIGKGSRMVGIVCHLDVVPAGSGWDTEPFKLTVKDGSFYGRGIVDDKGPAAISFFAMKELAKKDLPFRIRLILGTDEERTCSCVEYYDAHGEIPDIAITPDAEFPVIYAEKGILHLKISQSSSLPGFTACGGSAANMVPATAEASYAPSGINVSVTGKTAHASKPTLGINAIDLLPSELERAGFDIETVPLLKFIKEIDITSLFDISDESGALTSNNGILTMSEKEASLTADIRYPVSYSSDAVVTKLQDICSGYGLTVTIENDMAPLYKDKDSSEISLLMSVWNSHMDKYRGYEEAHSGLYSSPVAIGGGTYARHMRNTVAFGLQAPWQEDQCHQANEHMAVSDFEESIDVLKEALLLLGK
ncbi:MAG: Sapep family Mn(2+)-dependent dipeptidase [Clostridiales bacterium]|nr:Sapep family Mn(2+)-dependent dipeptidase [Clostridiales bacterium]